MNVSSRDVALEELPFKKVADDADDVSDDDDDDQTMPVLPLVERHNISTCAGRFVCPGLRLPNSQYICIQIRHNVVLYFRCRGTFDLRVWLLVGLFVLVTIALSCTAGLFVYFFLI